MLPGEVGDSFLSLWQEFEAAETPEAKFAHAMDRSVPIILNLANNGQSWRENGIRYEQVIKRNGPEVEKGCPALWDYLKQQLDEAQRQGLVWFRPLRQLAQSVGPLAIKIDERPFFPLTSRVACT